MQLQPWESVMFQTTAVEQCTVCVKQSLRLPSSQLPLPPCSHTARFGFGACQGQPAPNLCSDMKIAVATLLVLFSLAGCCHYCDSLCNFPLGNDWFTWLFEVKEAMPDFWCYKCSGKWTVFYLPWTGLTLQIDHSYHNKHSSLFPYSPVWNKDNAVSLFTPFQENANSPTAPQH